jgi:hypothetical protein
MKTRRETVEYVALQFGLPYNEEAEVYLPKGDKKLRHHYGMQELRDLLDYIYDSLPEEGEELDFDHYCRQERLNHEEWTAKQDAKQKENTIGNYLQGSILQSN